MPDQKTLPPSSSWQARSYLWISQIDPAVAFVLSVFLVLAVIHIRLVLDHSYPVPYWDESDFIPYVTGSTPIDLAWLWSPVNEHRIPLIRILYVLLARVTGLDQQLMNLVNVSLLAVTSILLLLALQKTNGKTQYTDAIIPLALLSLNHAANTLWPNQLQFILPTCVASLAAALFFLPDRDDLRQYWLLIPAVIVMALCGANGLPLALMFCPMLGWLAWRFWTAALRRESMITAIGLAVTLIYVGFYFAGLRKIHFPHGRPFVFQEGLQEGLKVAAQCFGSASIYYWPLSGIMAILLLATGAYVLFYRFAKNRQMLFVAAGLCFALAGFTGLALAVGMGRTVLGPDAGFAPRYATLVAPIPIVVLFILDRFAALPARNILRMAVFTVLCMACWTSGNVSAGDPDTHLADGKLLLTKVQAATSFHQLGDDFGSRWMFRPDLMSNRMRMMAKAHLGLYRKYAPPSGPNETLEELADNIETRGPSSSGAVVPLATIGVKDSGEAMIAHPIHRSTLSVPTKSKSIHIGFGIMPDNQTDGVEFRVSLRKANLPPVLLWSRKLDPVHVPSDVGLQQTDVALPPGIDLADRLVLETDLIKSPVACWAYWAKLAFN